MTSQFTTYVTVYITCYDVTVYNIRSSCSSCYLHHLWLMLYCILTLSLFVICSSRILPFFFIMTMSVLSSVTSVTSYTFPSLPLIVSADTSAFRNGKIVKMVNLFYTVVIYKKEIITYINCLLFVNSYVLFTPSCYSLSFVFTLLCSYSLYVQEIVKRYICHVFIYVLKHVHHYCKRKHDAFSPP